MDEKDDFQKWVLLKITDIENAAILYIQNISMYKINC